MEGVAAHAGDEDELLGGVERKGLDSLVDGVRLGVECGLDGIFRSIIVGRLRAERVDIDLFVGIESIPGVGVNDDTGFDLHDEAEVQSMSPARDDSKIVTHIVFDGPVPRTVANGNAFVKFVLVPSE